MMRCFEVRTNESVIVTPPSPSLIWLIPVPIILTDQRIPTSPGLFPIHVLQDQSRR